MSDEAIASSQGIALARGALMGAPVVELAAQDSGIVVGPGGSLKAGGVDLTGSPVSGDIRFETADPEVLKKALDFAAEIQTHQTDVLGKLLESEQASQTRQADVVTDLGKSVSTGGESDRNTIIAGIVLGLFVLLGVIFWRR